MHVPATWKGDASYHTPGTELVGSVINHNERVITIDDLLIADRFIAVIDEAMNHFDVRQIYSADAGRALAKKMDQNILQVGCLAARASATVSGGNGGTRIDDTTSGDADELVAAIFGAAQALDEKDVPQEDRYVFLKPADYYALIADTTTGVLNTDYNPEGNGSLKSGKIFRIAGMELVKTNNLPSTNVTTGPTAYRGDFSTTVGLAMHKSAVGTTKLIDLSTEMAYDIRRQGTLVVAKYAVGHGILRPESAVEIVSATL